MTKRELIQDLIDKVNELPFRDKEKLNVLIEEADRVISQFYGKTANYRADLKMARFTPWSFQSSESEYKTSWNTGKNALINLFEALLNDPTIIVIPPQAPPEIKKEEVVRFVPEEIVKSGQKTNAPSKIRPLQKAWPRLGFWQSLFAKLKSHVQTENMPSVEKQKDFSTVPNKNILVSDQQPQGASVAPANEKSPATEGATSSAKETHPRKKVFLVHGLEEGLKNEVAEALVKMCLEPVLTRGGENLQKTIMQKLVEYSDVSCAVVVLTADDFAYRKSGKPKEAKLRPVQDVVFELGVLIGKLGRNQVVVLHINKPNFELPMTYFDALYIPLDKDGGWKLELVDKLNTAGCHIDKEKMKKIFI